ncbi:MAG: CpsD/CapB family tyrosine-protein kinase [Verrucomicrobia bacterium]|jgi:protein-tyrosine kinase|nr:CpsD/CapB family tyrosine-protein kinase [Verrucomicrobiota bacterium]
MLSSNISRILGANRTEFSVLGGNLLSAAKGSLPKTVLVASSRAGEGRTTTAVAVAHTLATESNARVLLVDADTEAPSLHTCFELQKEPGLSANLDGGAPDSIMKSGIERLDVLPAGDAPEQTARALSSGGIVELLRQWSEHYDHIILDSSPVLTTSVPTSLAPHVDGILLVAECQRTKWQVLETAQEKLLGVGGRVLGVILNKRRYYIPKFLYGSV